VTLTTGQGPLSPHRAGRFNVEVPDPLVYVEPYRRRVRGILGGRTVVDRERVMQVHRPGQYPAYVVPIEDVDDVPACPSRRLQATCASPGTPSTRASTRTSRSSATRQPLPPRRLHPHDETRARRGRRRRARRHDTHERRHQTALAPRLHVHRDDVRMDLLAPSTTTTFCAYKGTASYWNARLGDVVVEDVAWSYEEPFADCARIRGRLCFDGARATVIDDLPP
jgi:uncharacterized protein (DUF427 family)